MKWVLIVGGGSVDLAQLEKELSGKPDIIIGADRGASYLYDLGIHPDILVGDFDSFPSGWIDLMNKVQARAGTIIKQYPCDKDQTDMELAMDLALEQDVGMIRILGGLGGRIDHTLGNIGLLIKALHSGVEAHLLDEKHDLVVINGKINLSRPGEEWSVSLIPLTGSVHGVTTAGLKYPLQNASLFFDKTRGIHNKFLDENSTVELTEGILLVCCFKE